jgi:DNA-binding NtrC family response regulator
MRKILVVDDDLSLHESLVGILREEWVLTSCTGASKAIRLLREETYDAVLLDIALPDQSGLTVLDERRSFKSQSPIIMLTAYSDVSTIFEASKRGADDFLAKPYSIDCLKNTLRAAATGYAARRAAEESEFGDFVGMSDSIVAIKRQVGIYARVNHTVLICGESGTGKEVVAKAIHRLSPRRSGKLIRLNIAAIPLNMLESELFGSERGAFTDAVSRPGCFEEAAGGTLFLDEIGDLDEGAQIRLLRVLEDKSVRRLGGQRDIPVDVRIIFATNQDLPGMVKAHKFRQDLFYRVNILPITLPPLREREGDVLVLAEYFLNGCGKTSHDIDDLAIERLLAHDWPGNVRELKAVIERAALLSGSGRIRSEHILTVRF